MISSDYKGNKHDPKDCRGYRAFKRACKQCLPWYKRMFINYQWIAYNSRDLNWYSINKKEENINMMSDTKSGDIVLFVNADSYGR